MSNRPSDADLAAWSQTPFTSQSELLEAFSDPRLRDPFKGHEYDRFLTAKVSISPDSAQAARGTVTSVCEQVTIGTPTTGGEVTPGAVSAQQITAANEQLAEGRGVLAKAPSSPLPFRIVTEER